MRPHIPKENTGRRLQPKPDERSRNCQNCGERFARDKRLSHKQWAKVRYCSQRCWGQFVRIPVEDRFRQFYKKDTKTGCWNWQSSLDGKRGYGFIGIDGKSIRAHRASWQIHIGHIPKDMHVLHRCDNPSCVNPSHLFLGTNQDNVNDKMQKGRHKVLRGSQLPTAKLTEDQVLKIRADRRTHSLIAADYCVSPSTISAIKNYQNWGYL